jgi:hypothetical protein
MGIRIGHHGPSNWRAVNPKKYRETDRKYRDSNRDKRRNSDRVLEQSIKKETIAHYSKTSSCVRCGFNDIIALSIDHKTGGGHKHMRSLGLSGGESYYRYLKRLGYPKEDPIGCKLEILCMNCQFIKAYENNERGRYKLK